ncbi:MAG: DUF2914 domain-containing protein [Bdellovibrionales bacterium]|nr:DUF2914 domain-containing protein [Bdellovibrionales bacterium]
MFASLKQRFDHIREKYEHQLDIVFFIGGFIFDAFMVAEPDEVFSIVQQIAYIFIVAALIHFELLFRLQKWHPTGRWAKLWGYRNLLLHFLLGTMLNIYSLFYIKSASVLNSILFLVLMAGMIVANELPFVKKSHVSFKVGLYAICVFSFFSILNPVLLGFVGWIPFGLAIAATLLVFFIQFKQLKKHVPDDKTLFRAILFPGISVLVVFGIFYFMKWIPPVPLSVREQGVYHLIEKKEGEYLLSTEKPWWKFWQSGDQEFKAEPGDKIYFYAQIYSPAKFSDHVYVQFAWDNPKLGWQGADRIPLKIVGGRKEGYRGYAIKSNYTPGDWRVQVVTEGGLEISRLYFTVESVPKNETRSFEVLKK